jgi:hypothetical protein
MDMLREAATGPPQPGQVALLVDEGAASITLVVTDSDGSGMAVPLSTDQALELTRRLIGVLHRIGGRGDA